MFDHLARQPPATQVLPAVGVIPDWSALRSHGGEFALLCYVRGCTCDGHVPHCIGWARQL